MGSLEEAGRKFLEKLENAIDIEEETFRKISDEIKPALLECLKSVQSSLSEDGLLVLDRSVLQNSNEEVRVGITACTASHVVVQQIAVVEGNVSPVEILVLTAEELVDRISSMEMLVKMATPILGFLSMKNSSSGNSFCV
jgi:hypothetical protein